jgi:DNA sulfur modification protein DndE
MKIFNRIRISTDATNKLRALNGKTGLTPNILCRIALCFSLNEGKITNLIPSDENGQEFNRFTLTGEYDLYFISLIKEQCINDKLNPETDFLNQFKQHINNGILIMHSRVKNLGDLTNLLSGSQND